MRHVKLAEMTSSLCHLLFLDGQGLHTGAMALWTFALVRPEGALPGELEGNGEVVRGFMGAYRREWRCVEPWGWLTGTESLFVRPRGQG